MSSVVETADQILQAAIADRRPLGAWLLDHTNPAGLGEFEELCWQYLHKLPAQFQLGQIKTRVEDELNTYGGFRYEFDSRLFLVEGDTTEPVGQLMVTLYRKPSGADADIFLELEQCQIWYPHLRGHGTGRAIVERVIALGQALGVKALTAIAIYDGRFVWPAIGFRFGDYLPDERAAVKFRRRFAFYCRRQGLAIPDISHLGRSRLSPALPPTIPCPLRSATAWIGGGKWWAWAGPSCSPVGLSSLLTLSLNFSLLIIIRY